MKKETVDFSVVVPVYNSEKSLKELHKRLSETFNQMNKTFEIIFVNDGSIDRSLKILKKIKKQNENVKVIDLYRNYGQQNALMCGFNYCSGRYIITMDDDLQHSTEDIPVLYNKILEGFDAVFGSYISKQDKFYKNFGSFLIRKLNHKIFNVKKNLKFSSFRIIRKDIIDQIRNNKTTFPYISGMLLHITRNIANVTVKHEKREYGKSNYTFKKLLKLSFNLLINHSTIPLRIFGYIGLLISFLSFFIGIIFMIKQIISGQAPAGWTSLIVLVSFYNTLILIIFFVIGEYISRILKESSNEKQYSVKEVLK